MTPPVEGPTEGLNAAVAAELRAEAGARRLNDKALALAAGVNYASLRRWLGKDVGNERHIDVAVLDAVCRALGTTPALIVEAAQIRLARESGYVSVESPSLQAVADESDIEGAGENDA